MMNNRFQIPSYLARRICHWLAVPKIERNYCRRVIRRATRGIVDRFNEQFIDTVAMVPPCIYRGSIGKPVQP